MPIVAIDIGGTFTDLASFDPETGALRFSKALTTPPDFEQGAWNCIRAAGIDARAISILRHGTTVVINALLERKGARTALVATEGFRDILEIGRGNRPEGFNLFYERLPPVVPRELRFDLGERIDARGNVLRPVDREGLARLAEQLTRERVESVAVCFLHAWRNPEHEIEVGAYLRRHTSCFVSCSHEISREFREFERTSTVALNAFVGPAVKGYIDRLEGTLQQEGYRGQLYLMGSNGGVLTRSDAEERPLLLVESGPVGGVAGAAEIGQRSGHPNVVAFDMGGTTAKAVLIENGEAQVSSIYWVGGYDRGYPAQAAVLDIVEVGYGGGSIAALNDFGALQVGPQSAGAVPGPACYDRGGTLPTVTDANLVLGRIDGDKFLGGSMGLDKELATRALEQLAGRVGQPLHKLAAGILDIAVINMANAVRQVTLQRGMDPRDFAMVAFGGAGPLHAVAVAREIGIGKVIIPPQPGHFSAYGMLFADFRYDLTATLVSPLATLDLEVLEREFAAMEAEGRRRVSLTPTPVNSVSCVRYAEMRYRRQEHTVKVRLSDGLAEAARETIGTLFEETYRRRYGHSSSNMEIEVVMLRVVVDGRTTRPALVPPAGRADPAPGARDIWFGGAKVTGCDAWSRPDLAVGRVVHGPCAIDEDASTTILGAGDTARIDATGNIVITLGAR